PRLATFASLTPNKGGRSAERRSGARRNTRGACHLASKTRVNALMTRHARRLRGALRPMTRDARLSALHRGGFGPRGRPSLLGVRPGGLTPRPPPPGRGAGGPPPGPPRDERFRAPAAGRHTPLRIQVRSRERALNERGCESYSTAAIRSQ